MAALRKVWNGYRVVWDVGWWLDYEDADKALDLYLSLRDLPAFQEDIRRPQLFRVSAGKLILPAVPDR